MTVRKIKSIGDIPYPIDVGTDALSPLLTAGAALGITGNVTESAAWLQRTSTSDGPTTAKSIHGRTLRWNQLVPAFGESVYYTGNVSKSFDAATNTLTLTSTTDNNVTKVIRLQDNSAFVSDHKFYIAATVTTDADNTATVALFSSSGTIIVGFTASAGSTNARLADVRSASSIGYFGIRLNSSTPSGSSATFKDVIAVDLTAMFGAGNEPSTVAEFEALYPASYYPYDAGSLMPVNMTGIETVGSNWTEQRTIDTATYFPNGMRSAGTVYDELTATQAITRIGERAYQSGDESDATVVTDGTITHYALATPTTVEIDPPMNMTYRTEQGGTERVMVPTGELSAPPTIVAAQGYTAESLRDAALATIAPVENGLASANYGVGAYLVHGGQLCRVTTAIATGESISIGTNVTATTVMAEVIALIAQ